MSYIEKGDIVLVDGKVAIAESKMYTKLVYDNLDYEIMRGGGEGGTAISCVDVVFPETGTRWSAQASRVTKVGRDCP